MAKKWFHCSATALHCGIKVIEIYFTSAIKRFAPDMPRAHDQNECGRWDISATALAAPGVPLQSAHRQPTREAHVDLTLKFDVLAVCAVFVFVGAILLGAF